MFAVHLSRCADLVIRIPGDLSQQDGFYRLDYNPPVGKLKGLSSNYFSEGLNINQKNYNFPIGFPSANTTFRPLDISDVIAFSRGLPGTKYDFKLYYSNSSVADYLTWTASITTAPDPPSNLSIDVVDGKNARCEMIYTTQSGKKIYCHKKKYFVKSIYTLVFCETVAMISRNFVINSKIV